MGKRRVGRGYGMKRGAERMNAMGRGDGENRGRTERRRKIIQRGRTEANSGRHDNVPRTKKETKRNETEN
jgi:hypothetical protein